MRFLELCKAFSAVEATSSQTQMQERIAQLLGKVPVPELSATCHLLLGEIASESEGVNLGMADRLAIVAIAHASKKPEANVFTVYKKTGDIGTCAAAFISLKGSLTVTEVYTALHRIAATSGSGSQESKITALSSLLSKSSSLEAMYLSRLVVGNLRLGAGTMTLLTSLAIVYGNGKKDKAVLEDAYNTCPDIGIIAETIARTGLKGLRTIGVVVGRPVRCMLAQRVNDLSEVSERMKTIVCEEKYDGERVQVHKKGSRVWLFSRRMEDITAQYPDIVSAVLSQVRGREFVIEGEAVAVDAKGNLLPFQSIMQRRRKHDVAEFVKKIPVCLFVFDCLFYEGKTFLDSDLLLRRKQLQKIIRPSPSLQLSRQIVTSDLGDVEEFFNVAIEHGGEGIMAKNGDAGSVYQAGTRGWNWIKWKREYSHDLRDTLDVVIVGAYLGRGKRAGGYGALLCAVYNEKMNRYETLCKLGTGFSDADLASLPKRLDRYKTKTQPKQVVCTSLMKPDVWFLPAVVCEVLGAELTYSPIHTAGAVSGVGLALRFPRLLKWRLDKKSEQATTVTELRAMVKKRESTLKRKK